MRKYRIATFMNGEGTKYYRIESSPFFGILWFTRTEGYAESPVEFTDRKAAEEYVANAEQDVRELRRIRV